jgi:hypothetical protein
MQSSVQPLLYHTALPQNNKPVYRANDVVDFRLSSNGRDILGGMIRVLFDVHVNYGPEADPEPSKVAYDAFTGGHIFISRVDTELQNVGQIESIPDYNRYIASKAQASMIKETTFNSTNVCELRVADDTIACSMLKGTIKKAEEETNSLLGKTTDIDASLKLDFCLNNMLASPLIHYSKTGDITITLTLAPNTCLFGDSTIGSSIFYELKNLRVFFMSVPPAAKLTPMVMRLKWGTKQSLQSSYFSYSTSAPIEAADSVWATFIEQSSEDSPSHNSMKCERLPIVSQLQWLWNDSASNQITYVIDNEEEILDGFITAVSKDTGVANCNQNALASNKGWGVGLGFSSPVNLTQTKLSINLASGIQSTNPYAMYLYFSGLMSI